MSLNRPFAIEHSVSRHFTLIVCSTAIRNGIFSRNDKQLDFNTYSTLSLISFKNVYKNLCLYRRKFSCEFLFFELHTAVVDENLFFYFIQIFCFFFYFKIYILITNPEIIQYRNTILENGGKKCFDIFKDK